MSVFSTEVPALLQQHFDHLKASALLRDWGAHTSKVAPQAGAEARAKEGPHGQQAEER